MLGSIGYSRGGVNWVLFMKMIENLILLKTRSAKALKNYFIRACQIRARNKRLNVKHILSELILKIWKTLNWLNKNNIFRFWIRNQNKSMKENSASSRANFQARTQFKMNWQYKSELEILVSIHESKERILSYKIMKDKEQGEEKSGTTILSWFSYLPSSTLCWTP